MAEKNSGMGEAWGWRGVLGYISPSVSGKVEKYLYQLAPEGVGFLTATLGMDAPHDDKEVEKALSKVDEAARQLADGGADFIYMGGDPLVLIKGYGWDKELIKRLQEITGLPCTTSVTCCVNALKALSIKKLVVVTPQGSEQFIRRKKKFMSDSGFEVINIKGLGSALRNAEKRKLPMHVPYDLAKQAYLDTPTADGIYLGCPYWGGPAVVEYLERDLGKPVVTGHQAFIWAGLKVLNIREPIKGYGRLLEMP